VKVKQDIDGVTVEFELDGSAGYYGVSFEGEPLGEVRRWSRSYNLRRPVTLHGWQAFANGEKVAAPSVESGAWRRRADAIAALYRHARGSA
jgi:hypothetical protein